MKIKSLLPNIFLIVTFSCSSGENPDLILYNGVILTINDTDEVVEAVAVKDGLILAVGYSKDILKLKGASTKLIDLESQTMVPGFIAAHEHPTLSAVFGGLVDMSGLTHSTSEQVWNALKSAVAKSESGEHIFAMGFDPVLVPKLVMPNIKMLDQIAPENPVLIIAQSMHSFWANSLAFEVAGITKDSPSPGKGSFYGKNSAGELTGFISEVKASMPFIEPLKNPLRILKRYEDVLDSLLANGFTSVGSLGFNAPPWLAKYASYRNFSPRIRQFLYLAKHEWSHLPGNPDYSDPFFRIQGIKLWHDGSPYTGSMYLKQPYLVNNLTRAMGILPHTHGEAVLDNKEFKQVFEKYNSAGWQIATHSQGDKSNLEVQSAIVQIDSSGKNEKRHRLEHGILLPKEALPGYAALNMTPSFHINHIYYYGDSLAESIIGTERADKLLPVKAAFELKMRPTLHADAPMFPTDAFSLIKTAVTRKTRSGRVLGKEQAITVQQGLRALTINGAWQLYEDERLGSIEKDKFADLTILSANPYTVDADELDKIKVNQVYLQGELVYKRE
jgi:predicted amidohydrolase YtcJ